MALPAAGMGPALHDSHAIARAGSSGRPGHLPAADDVRVHVTDGLAAVRASVEDHPIAGIGDALLAGHQMRLGGHLGQQPVAGCRKSRQIVIVGTRNDEHMNGSLRINVPERDGARTLQNAGCRDLTSGDTAEQAIGHAADLNVWRAGATADIYGCTTANPRRATPLVHGPPGPSPVALGCCSLRSRLWELRAWGEVRVFMQVRVRAASPEDRS